jgi:hypothetical protein
MFQLATDYPLLNVKYNFTNITEVPVMEICASGYFKILDCRSKYNSKYNNGTNVHGGCMGYLSDIRINTTSTASDHRKYCYTFNSTEKFDQENPNGLNKLKFFFNINKTEAEAEALGVAALNIHFSNQTGILFMRYH